MLAPERVGDLAVVGFGAITSAAGAVFAATDSLGTGLVIGSAGVLGLMFRYWFAENKRNTAETWNHADEYRIERDYYRALADHWQARWLAVVSPEGAAPVTIPEVPDMDKMKEEARSEKEGRRGVRR